MKIYCEKCHEDISIECCRHLENHLVGRPICPKCHYEQHRYISEADLLLNFGISEILYIIMTLIMMAVFKYLGISLYSVIILLATLTGYYFLSKAISAGIYQKAYFKHEIRNKVFPEDSQAIQRSMSWQFMLFFAIVFSYATLEEGKIFFLIAMPLAVVLTFIKFYLKLKSEKES